MDSGNNARTPKPIKWGIAFLVFGVIFPIYGTPPGLFDLPRLTFFRLGLIILLFNALFYRISLLSVIKQLPVALLLFLLILRILSLLFFTPHALFYRGATQIWWYSQGFLCLVLILAFVRRWPYLKRYLYSLIVFFGAIAALLTSYQFIEFTVFGSKFALPFSMTKFGVIDPIYSGWYPLGPGGRAMGPFFDPNMTGTFMVLFICILLPSIISSQNQQMSLSWKMLCLFIIALFAMFVSGARQAVLILVAICYIYFILMLAWKHSILVVVLRFILTVIVFIALVQGYHYLETHEVSYRNYSSLGRLASGIQTGSFGKARWDTSEQMLLSLDYEILLFGFGEGTGLWTAHNAYIIVLYENGLWAVLALVSAGYLMLIKNVKNANRSIKLKLNDPVVVARPLIVLSWMLMIGMNWAQLNQSFPWIFLALVLMPPGWVANRKNRTTYRFLSQ